MRGAESKEKDIQSEREGKVLAQLFLSKARYKSCFVHIMLDSEWWPVLFLEMDNSSDICSHPHQVVKEKLPNCPRPLASNTYLHGTPLIWDYIEICYLNSCQVYVADFTSPQTLHTSIDLTRPENVL